MSDKPKFEFNGIGEVGLTIPLFGDFAPLISYTTQRVFSGHDKRITVDDLSPDQKHVLDGLSARVADLGPGETTSLGGYAGTGKSTLIPLLAENLGSISRTAFCCFTGKAANVLKRKLEAAGIHESDAGFIGTIHSLIYVPTLDHRGLVVRWSKKDQLLNTADSLLDRIVIDEASMVSKKLLEDLCSYGIPVVLVGDHGQLEPVEGEPTLGRPDFRLEQIHRQAAENPIIQLSQTIRQHGDIPKNLKESEAIQFITSSQLGQIAVKGFDEHGLDMGLLVRSNAKRNTFNQKAASGSVPRVDDIVICLKNNPPIFNGMRGFVRSIEPTFDHWYRVNIEFPDDGLNLNTLINKHQFNHPKTLSSVYELYSDFAYPRAVGDTGMLFDFGMALTVHKAQGSAFEKVILCPEYWPSFDSTGDGYKRWLYTGVTRAAQTLYLLKS